MSIGYYVYLIFPQIDLAVDGHRKLRSRGPASYQSSNSERIGQRHRMLRYHVRLSAPMAPDKSGILREELFNDHDWPIRIGLDKKSQQQQCRQGDKEHDKREKPLNYLQPKWS